MTSLCTELTFHVAQREISNFETMNTTRLFENCLQRLRNGELQARDELISRVSDRLTVLAERMLSRTPGVARWERAEDLAQESIIRLHRCLAKVVPSTPEEFLKLAALQLRRELCDMARHHLGPHGHGAQHDSQANILGWSGIMPQLRNPNDSNTSPQTLALWSEFHATIDTLPDNEKQVFDLLWYHDLSQAEAAEILCISERQLRRYWQSALTDAPKAIGR